jgi:hypothetical protein
MYIVKTILFISIILIPATNIGKKQKQRKR